MPHDLSRAIARAAQHATAQGTGRREVIPAPVRGLNTRDPEVAMDPRHALVMQNMLPEHGRVRTRRGSAVHVSDAGAGLVDSLFAWRSGTRAKLFAIGSGKVYDATDTGDSLVAVVSAGVTPGERWQGVNMNGHGMLFNGTDAPLRIDSSGTWVAHAFTQGGTDSLTETALWRALVHHNRLWIIEKSTPYLWYGGTNSVQGDLNRIDLSLVDGSGGNVVAMGSLTLDTGKGVDDLLVLFMGSGTVLVYSGTNPSEADGFGLVGRFQLPAVIGDQPVVKLGGDLIAITSQGYLPILQFLARGREQRQLAISDAIGPSVSEAVRDYGDLSGWEIIVYPEANWLLINIPIGAGRAFQHVQSLQERGWGRFSALNASCWALHDKRIFFGSSGGKVWEANTGGDDDGNAIPFAARCAYNYLSSPYPKQFRMLKVHLDASAGTTVTIGAVADFDQDGVPVSSSEAVDDQGGVWDEAEWDEAEWADSLASHRGWRTMTESGAAVSIQVEGNAKDAPVEWFGVEVLYDQVKGVLL